MAFCENCGKQIDDSASLCNECMASRSNANNSNNSGNSNSSFDDTVNKAKDSVSSFLNTPDHTSEFSTKEIEDNKIICAISYIAILFWLPLVAGTKNSKYCRFHVNQSIVLAITSIILSIIGMILGIIPILGDILGALLSLASFLLFIFGLVNTVQGKAKELPLIGGIKIIK